MSNVLVTFYLLVNFSHHNTIFLGYFSVRKFFRIHFDSVFDLWMITIECLREIIWLVFTMFIYDIINDSLRKLGFGWFNHFSLCFSYISMKIYYREWLTYGTSIYLFIKFGIQHKSIICCQLKQQRFEYQFWTFMNNYSTP